MSVFIDWDGVPEKNNYSQIDLANVAWPLDQIFQRYQLQFEEQFASSGWTHKAKCPFPDHADSTASFYFNPEINMFHCFGCQRSGKAVEFLHVMQGTPKLAIAQTLLAKKNVTSIKPNGPTKAQVHVQIRNILFDFSDKIVQWKESHPTQEAFNYADLITWSLEAYLRNHVPQENINLEQFKARAEACWTKILEFEDLDE